MMAGPSQTCIILAGGLGTRLQSVIGDLPKCLAPVGRHSFLEMQIRQLATIGVDHVVLSLGYLADRIIKFIDQVDSPLPIQYVTEREQLGTGGAILHAMETLGLEEVLVSNGDTWLEGDLTSMLAPLEYADGERFRMAVVDVIDRTRFGRVEADPQGRICRFIEKGRGEGGLINAGFYRLCRQALPFNRVAGPLSLELEVLPHLASLRAIRACKIHGTFIDIGIPEDYYRFCNLYDEN
jgi:D-glycero-alpha-D-manno-heptose 1-phosphate guanylyltransferase